MDYIVEVRDIYKGVILYQNTFDDANTAYHQKRIMEDTYRAYDPDSTVQVLLFEPEF